MSDGDEIVPLTKLAGVLRHEHNVIRTYHQLYSGYVNGTLPIEQIDGRRLGVRRCRVPEIAQKIAPNPVNVAA